jgi:hypothetical protein
MKSLTCTFLFALLGLTADLPAQPPAGSVPAKPNIIYYAGGSCTFYDINNNVLLSVNAAEASWSASPARAAWVVVNPTSGGYYEFPNYSANAPTCNLRQYLQPFWKSDTIFNELVLLNGVNAKASLMYKPTKVLSVTNYDFSQVYQAGTDYAVSGRVITQLSTAVSATAEQKVGQNKLLNTKPTSWTCVTYIPDRSDWRSDALLASKGNLLPKTLAKLKVKQSLVVQAYGMSITAGLNVSGFAGDTKNFPVTKPYMHSYVDLFCDELSRKYGSSITNINGSCGGKTAAWVDQYCQAMVNPNKPDLVLLDMGMNDIWGTAAASFRSSMASAIQKIKADCPDAEFILIGNMLPDVNGTGAPSTGATAMYGFLTELKGLEANGVALFDMTTLSDTIYRRKGVVHCTSNALHPNDYLARWYAHGLMQLIQEPAAATAKTYYVNTTGNNSDGLSIATAWTSLDKVNTAVFNPGDRVLFEGGKTFTGNIVLDQADGNSAANPILFGTYGSGKATIKTTLTTVCGFQASNTQGIVLRNLIFTGPGNGTQKIIDGIQFYTNKTSGYLSNIQLKQVEVSGFGFCGIQFMSEWNNTVKGGFRDVWLDSCSVHHCRENGIVSIGYDDQSLQYYQHFNFRITNTKVYNITGYAASMHKGSGIVLSQVDSVLIERCEAYENGSGNTACGGPGGIWVWSANRVRIQFCESHHNRSGSGAGCDGLGFDLDGGVTNSILQYNYAHDNDGAGYLLGNFRGARPWGNNIVRYNISVNDARTNMSPITLFTAPGTTWDGLQFYHNTVHVTPAAGNKTPEFSVFQMTDFGSSMANVACYNNIFSSTGGIRMLHIPATFTAQNPRFMGNLYWGSGSAASFFYGSARASLADFRAAGVYCEKNGAVNTGMEADPMLSNVSKQPPTVAPLAPQTLDAFRLQAGSPALNAALYLKQFSGIQAGSRDFFGNQIPQGSAADIGAHELPQGLGTAHMARLNSCFQVFPNPAGTMINLDFKGPLHAREGNVLLADASGRTIAVYPAGTRSIDIQKLNPGIYLFIIPLDGMAQRISWMKL